MPTIQIHGYFILFLKSPRFHVKIYNKIQANKSVSMFYNFHRQPNFHIMIILRHLFTREQHLFMLPLPWLQFFTSYICYPIGYSSSLHFIVSYSSSSLAILFFIFSLRPILYLISPSYSSSFSILFFIFSL